MKKKQSESFRQVIERKEMVKVAGAHDALGGLLAEEAGFDAVWSSSFEVSAARGLPDASVLTMTEYLEAAANIQKSLSVPVVADCDTGYGNNLNVAHMVHEYESAGITAICIEDKLYPKMNSFAGGNQTLLSVEDFRSKIETAKASQASEDFFVIARTEALIEGLGVPEALARCKAYCDSGADSVLIHSKAPTNSEVSEFLSGWDEKVPVVVVPTTYPDWHADEAAREGVSVVIYANQGLRSTISALRNTFERIQKEGQTTSVEDDIASVSDIFELQNLSDWKQLQK